MQIKVIVQKSITGCLIQLEEKRKVKRATCSDIHAQRKRARNERKVKGAGTALDYYKKIQLLESVRTKRGGVPLLSADKTIATGRVKR